jgi:hypothetical protein
VDANVPQYEYLIEHVWDYQKLKSKNTTLTEILNKHGKEGWEHYFSIIMSPQQLDLYFRRTTIINTTEGHP